MAAPTTTLDPSTKSGAFIHIEERPESELTMMFGQKIAPDGIRAWNPAFDVTPSTLITGIITERGVIRPSLSPNNALFIDVAAFLASSSKEGNTSTTAAAVKIDETIVPAGFERLDEDRLRAYIAQSDCLTKLLGISIGSDGSELRIKEVGDGK